MGRLALACKAATRTSHPSRQLASWQHAQLPAASRPCTSHLKQNRPRIRTCMRVIPTLYMSKRSGWKRFQSTGDSSAASGREGALRSEASDVGLGWAASSRRRGLPQQGRTDEPHIHSNGLAMARETRVLTYRGVYLFMMYFCGGAYRMSSRYMLGW